ncbi:MAG: type I 3-dehydroquinate dehydratase [Deltaproteobacteria bacterium]|nr:type I 3-dehydroquinate dehydratase [Deltaproteobacteria bacterium]
MMRLQSEIKVTVKDKVIGGPKPLVCLPLVARETSELLEQTESLKRLAPDLLEWRIDGFAAVSNVSVCLAALKELQAAIGNIPLIFTCRIHAEGGLQALPQKVRLELVTAAIASGGLDIVDIELCNEPAFIESVKQTARENGSKLVLSYHNFTDTPEAGVIHDKLLQAQDAGADIAKVAVTPKNYADVLVLLSATYEARTGAVNVPIVTMSMGPEGGVTRVAGGLFGSDITFAVGKESSAPGQIPIEDLRKAMAVLYH